VARAIGWVFVAFVAYHAILAAGDAWSAAREGSWPRAAGFAAIALVGTALVVGAVAYARTTRRRVRRRT
jgi:uncharacterized membrane protein required for colicin V production